MSARAGGAQRPGRAAAPIASTLTVLTLTALTLAAWKGKPSPDHDEVIEAAELALPHRMRRKPFQDVDFDVKKRLSADDQTV